LGPVSGFQPIMLMWSLISTSSPTCRLEWMPPAALVSTTARMQHELVLARRMARLGTETAFEVLSKAKALERQGRSIIHLEIGEPDFDTPPNIVEAAVDALRKAGPTTVPSAGLPELREAIANYVSRTRGVTGRPDEVVVVPGGKPIMFYVMLALIDEGDEVIYPNPGFPIYESMINYAGGTAVPIPLREERDFAMDVDEMAAADHPAHQAHHSQLAAEPHRRRSAARRHRAGGRGHRRPQHHGALRRDLQPPAV
jgi:DNA-binding transcriptional MocR family regulator